jgi:hypothetical protein
MDREGKVIELRDLSGGLILSLMVVERPLQEKPKETKNNNQPPKGEEKSGNHDAYMTDAQKRYLFRILTDQGKEGEEAHDYLKSKIFQVKSLKEVTKFEASQAIERLLAGAKGGAGK